MSTMLVYRERPYYRTADLVPLLEDAAKKGEPSVVDIYVLEDGAWLHVSTLVIDELRTALGP